MVVARNRWYRCDDTSSRNNPRGFLGVVREERREMGTVVVHLWRSYSNVGVGNAVHAPAWRHRNGRELYSMRKERGFRERVEYEFELCELVGEVRGVACRGGVRIADCEDLTSRWAVAFLRGDGDRRRRE